MLIRPKELLKAKRASNKGAEAQTSKSSVASGPAVDSTAITSNATLDKQNLVLGAVKHDVDWLHYVMDCPQDGVSLEPTLLTDKELKAIQEQSLNEYDGSIDHQSSSEGHPSTTSIYRPLTPWQTRLLKLLPGEGNSTLSCTMVEVNIIDGHGVGMAKPDGTSEILFYHALSYSWGYPAPVCSILCNDTPLGIALELATALLYLRSSTANRYIWCDAICINQKDLVEKAHQVKIMLRIFEKADLVVAWIGKPTLSTGRLFTAMKFVGNGSHDVQTHHLDEKQSTAISEIRSALKVHLSSAWFLRTWCRQEVYAAKKLVIQVGPYKLPFEVFIQKLSWLQTMCDWSQGSDLKLAVPSTLQVYKHDYQHRGTDRHDFERKTELPSYVEHWIDVLRSGSLFEVSDERDRIYGALGLLTSMSVKFFARLPANPESLAAAFPIDYKKDISEVYQDVTKFLINSSQTLEILDIFRDRRNVEIGRTPSWATDWSRNREEYGLFHKVVQPRYGFKNVLEQDYKDTGRLHLAGIRVATRITSVDADKDISHPRDRFKPKYRRPISLQDIMKGSTRRTRSGLASEIHNPPYSFVFTHVEESEAAFEMYNHTMNAEEMDTTLASWLAGANYVFAFVEDLAGDPSLGLADLHILVPRNVVLDDILVSLYGSRCLHLLRPIGNDSEEFRYIGPVAAVACGLEYTLMYSPKGRFGRKSYSKDRDNASHHKRETFFIV